MSWRDRDWAYNDAATTARPGYLKRRFAAIRKALREKAEAEIRDEAERRDKVKTIRKTA
jgi:uncharacterized protein YydD (DUF2326 family)